MDKNVIASLLEEARLRSLALLDPLSEEAQFTQHSPIMSPLVWDLAHVGNYEEWWLLRSLAGHPTTSKKFDDMYNPFIHPRPERVRLPLLGPREARDYITAIRRRAFEVLEQLELDPAEKLLADGFVYGLVVQHEHQHDETMLATLQLMRELAIAPPHTGPAPEAQPIPAVEVKVEGGPFVMGTDSEPWAYDNERPAHIVHVDSFWIDTTPVSNAQYLDFVESGGYESPRYWSEDGWAWRLEANLQHPEFWKREGQGGWSVMRFGRQIELPSDEPVQHVCWYEADAYARWAGKRLPTEAEWEMAASWRPSGDKSRFPWGTAEPTAAHANLGQRHTGPAGTGAYPEGESPWGCRQMIGDVWEWTASDFTGYPGFSSFPYKEYSEVFFGPEYKVLRGGSWATHPLTIRTTFRNWDYPIRRQIFAGFRCARDV